MGVATRDTSGQRYRDPGYVPGAARYGRRKRRYLKGAFGYWGRTLANRRQLNRRDRHRAAREDYR